MYEVRKLYVSSYIQKRGANPRTGLLGMLGILRHILNVRIDDESFLSIMHNYVKDVYKRLITPDIYSDVPANT